jgi:hypothetical protein
MGPYNHTPPRPELNGTVHFLFSLLPRLRRLYPAKPCATAAAIVSAMKYMPPGEFSHLEIAKFMQHNFLQRARRRADG